VGQWDEGNFAKIPTGSTKKENPDLWEEGKSGKGNNTPNMGQVDQSCKPRQNCMRKIPRWGHHRVLGTWVERGDDKNRDQTKSLVR